MRHRLTDEHGATAVLVAASLLFLLGAAALALDVSGFYQRARTEQTTADLTCLAGVAELPDDTAARTMAADFARLNWPDLSSAYHTAISATMSELSNGTDTIRFETAYGGNPRAMKVSVLEASDTRFGAVLGFQSVQVVQEAHCEGGLFVAGGGVLPFGAITGGWTGPLQIDPPCGPSNGNCGSLAIPRDDVLGAGPQMIKNIAGGPEPTLVQSRGPASGAADCRSITSGGSCSILETDTGVSAAQLGQGLFDRLNNDPGATCTFSYQGGTLNCDSPSQILGGAWTPLMTEFPTKPGWWDERLLGTYNATNTNKHYWYNDDIAKCDSPRLGGIPIVTDDLDWELGDPHTGWPNGKKAMKVVGMLDIIIEEPYDAGDFEGNKNLKTAGASVVWFGPKASCDGHPIGVLNGVDPSTATNAVRLVAG